MREPGLRLVLIRASAMIKSLPDEQRKAARSPAVMVGALKAREVEMLVYVAEDKIVVPRPE